MDNHTILANGTVTSYQNLSVINGRLEGVGIMRFFTDTIYEGEVVGGLMHGQGTYTWSDGVKYKGEFNDGRITGTGRYDLPDGSWYSGEVLNGKKHGFGAYCDGQGFKFYVGHWKNDMKHGQGRLDFNAEGTWFYSGEWVDNQRHGYGTQHFESGNIYNGEWKDGRLHGWGTMYWPHERQLFEGNWKQGFRQGHGEQYWLIIPTCSVSLFRHHMYKGEWLNDKRDGFGIFIYADGAKYEGNWKNNKKCGEGIFFFKNGMRYDSVFDNDMLIEMVGGKRTLTTPISKPEDNTIILFCPDFTFCLPDLPDQNWSSQTLKIRNLILTKETYLKNLYYTYSQLGKSEDSISAGILDGLRFLQLCRDLKLECQGWSLADILAVMKTGNNRVFWPVKRIMPWKFVRKLMIVAYAVYNNFLERKLNVLESLKMLFVRNIIPWKNNYRGVLFAKPERTAYVILYVDALYNMYRKVCAAFQENPEKDITVRQFLLFMENIHLIGKSKLSIHKLINILMYLVPTMKDGDLYKMDTKLCFLDFTDAILACSEAYFTTLKPEHAQEIFGNLRTETVVDVMKKDSTDLVKVFSSTPAIGLHDSSEHGSTNDESHSSKLAMEPVIPLQLLTVSYEDIRLLTLAKDKRKPSLEKTTSTTTNHVTIQHAYSHHVQSVSSPVEYNILKYFEYEKLGDMTGSRDVDIWILKARYFLDKLFIPAATIWMMIRMEMDWASDERAALDAVESFSNIVLPHANISTIWFDES